MFLQLRPPLKKSLLQHLLLETVLQKWPRVESCNRPSTGVRWRKRCLTHSARCSTPSNFGRTRTCASKSFHSGSTNADQSLRPLYFCFRVSALPENPPAIDWSYYQQKVAIPGLVETFKAKYESLEVPYPGDNVTQQIVAQQTATVSS